MRLNKNKIRIILGCIGVVIVLLVIYCAYVINSLNYIGNTKIPNMTIELKNDSNQHINYSVVIGDKNPIKGYLEKTKESQIKVVYGSNSSDRLQIKINDEDGNMICETRPSLNIKPQHLYNAKIQYKLEVVFRNNELQMVQIK